MSFLLFIAILVGFFGGSIALGHLFDRVARIPLSSS